jgi:hypothetical protein
MLMFGTSFCTVQYGFLCFDTMFKCGLNSEWAVGDEMAARVYFTAANPHLQLTCYKHDWQGPGVMATE